jgi:hypothetical protein
MHALPDRASRCHVVPAEDCVARRSPGQGRDLSWTTPASRKTPRSSIRIDVATQRGEPNLFQANAFQLRCEIPVGIGILRAQAFAVVALGGGS